MAHRLSGRRLPMAAVVVTACLATAAAATTPFTPGAEATVVAGYLVVLSVLPLRWTTGEAATGARPGRTGGAGGTAEEAAGGHRRGWRWAVVVAPLVVVLAWELISLAHGDRADWPTLSSLLDGLDASPLGRGVAYASWLGLGWALVTR